MRREAASSAGGSESTTAVPAERAPAALWHGCGEKMPRRDGTRSQPGGRPAALPLVAQLVNPSTRIPPQRPCGASPPTRLPAKPSDCRSSTGNRPGHWPMAGWVAASCSARLNDPRPPSASPRLVRGIDSPNGFRRPRPNVCRARGVRGADDVGSGCAWQRRTCAVGRPWTHALCPCSLTALPPPFSMEPAPPSLRPENPWLPSRPRVMPHLKPTF